MPRLCNQTRHQLADKVTTFGYDRASLDTGIVHLGPGAFHRAHQAVYTHRVLEQQPGPWRIAGVSLQSSTTSNHLSSQDNLYTVVSEDDKHQRADLIGSLSGCYYIGEHNAVVESSLQAENTRIISLTVTEKAYAQDSHVVSLLAQTLAARYQLGRPPLSILSCDNLAHNGAITRELTLTTLGKLDTAAARWAEDNISFPSSMVDRIVPATTGQSVDKAEAILGLRDEAVLFTEPFSQWVIEDHFTNGRPAWETAGAIMASSVYDYEQAKLRLLNGAHSTFAYLGTLAGHELVSDCMQDRVVRDHVDNMMNLEVKPVLTPPGNLALSDYINDLLSRFANSKLQHRLKQIAMDGTKKLPQRLLPTIEERLSAGLPVDRLALSIAAWMIFVRGKGLNGETITVEDPQVDKLTRVIGKATDDPVALTGSLLMKSGLFSDYLKEHAYFKHLLADYARHLLEQGVAPTIRMIPLPAGP